MSEEKDKNQNSSTSAETKQPVTTPEKQPSGSAPVSPQAAPVSQQKSSTETSSGVQPTQPDQPAQTPKASEVKKPGKTSSKSARALILVDANHLTWLQEGVANVLTLQFPADSVKHLEIIKKDAVLSAVKSFIDENNLTPAHCTILLSSKLLFLQDFPKDADPKKNTELQDKFLAVVPFEDIVYCNIESGKNFRIIAANQEYYGVVKEALSDKGFSIDCVAPVIALGDNYAQTAALDAQIAKAAFSAHDTLKKYNLSPIKKYADEQVKNPLVYEDREMKPTSNSRQYILLGVFGLLLVVLGVVVYFFVLNAPEEPKPRLNTQSAAPKKIPSPTQVIISSESSPSAALNLEDFDVQILYTGTQEYAEELQELLEEAGLTEISNRNAGSINLSRTQVVFSPDVPITARNEITSVIRRQYEDVQVLENQTAQIDITITTVEISTPEE